MAIERFAAFLFLGVKMMMLEESRRRIDAIDTEILVLLNRRAEISRDIAMIKISAALPVADPRREDDILRGLVRENEGPLDDQAITDIYRAILQESRRIQVNEQRSLHSGGGIY